MLLTMKAPANRDKGQRTVRCNEAQANILRKIGWTEVEQYPPLPQHTLDALEKFEMREEGESPQGQTISPDPVEDPDEVRPKRKYTRRVIIAVDNDGNASIKPKRRYRRRDLTAEE